MTVEKLLSNGGELIGSRALGVEIESSGYDIVISRDDVSKLLSNNVTKYDFLNNGRAIIKEYAKENKILNHTVQHKDTYGSIAAISHSLKKSVTIANVPSEILIVDLINSKDENINNDKIGKEWRNIIELLIYYDVSNRKINLFIFDTHKDKDIIHRYQNIVIAMKSMDKKELRDKKTRVEIFRALKKLNKLM